MMNKREAEVATENYWKSKGAVKTRRPVRTKWQKVDFLGADVLAVMRDGSKSWTQTTTSQRPEHVRERRRALEETPWASTDRVYVFEVEERPGVVNKRKVDRYFRVHEYRVSLAPEVVSRILSKVQGVREWVVLSDPIPIPDEWLRVKEKVV